MAFSILKSLFPERAPSYVRFRDNLGNFDIFYPRGWKYDENIAVVDGKYTVSFQAPGGRSQFTISVDTKLPEKFSLKNYMKEEFESPSSGIYAPGVKTRFRSLPAFKREFSYVSGKAYFGFGLIFRSSREVFTINWTAPESGREQMEKIFSHMLESLVIKEGPGIERKLFGGGSFEFSPPAEENAGR